MEKVLVLMSTYNGEKYLNTQIESILLQKGVQVDLLIRDDGSTDSTIKILQEYQSKGKLSYYIGSNLKPSKSFMDLVCNAPQADYYAFSDQDDYWFPNKLSCAIKKIQESSNMDVPCLYYCKPIWTDQNLIPFVKQPNFIQIKTFPESIVFNNVAGCTMVFNGKLQELIKQYTPKSSIMHDNWIFKLCLAIGGQVVFDNNSFIYYRQHIQNVCGGNGSLKKRWKKRFYNLFNKNKNYLNVFKELVDNYSSIMPYSNLMLCRKILDYRKGLKYKFKLLKDFSIYTNNIKENIIFVLKIFLETF